MDLTNPQVVLVKLTNGENFVARVTENPNDKYEIRKPIVFRIVQAEGSPPQVQPMPWLPFHDITTSVFLPKNQVLCFASLDKEVQNMYNQVVGEGILIGGQSEVKALDQMKTKLGNKRGR